MEFSLKNQALETILCKRLVHNAKSLSRHDFPKSRLLAKNFRTKMTVQPISKSDCA